MAYGFSLPVLLERRLQRSAAAGLDLARRRRSAAPLKRLRVLGRVRVRPAGPNTMRSDSELPPSRLAPCSPPPPRPPRTARARASRSVSASTRTPPIM